MGCLQGARPKKEMKKRTGLVVIITVPIAVTGCSARTWPARSGNEIVITAFVSTLSLVFRRATGLGPGHDRGRMAGRRCTEPWRAGRQLRPSCSDYGIGEETGNQSKEQP